MNIDCISFTVLLKLCIIYLYLSGNYKHYYKEMKGNSDYYSSSSPSVLKKIVLPYGESNSNVRTSEVKTFVRKTYYHPTPKNFCLKTETIWAFLFFAFAIAYMALFQIFTDEIHYNINPTILNPQNPVQMEELVDYTSSLSSSAYSMYSSDSWETPSDTIFGSDYIYGYFSQLNWINFDEDEPHPPVKPITRAVNNFAQIGDDEIVLHDSGFVILPYISNSHIADYFVNFLFVFTIVFVSFYGCNKQDGFRRMFWIVGLLYVVRAFTISMTVLPSPYPNCNSQQRYYSPSTAAIKVILGMHVTCGDVLYSGHTMVINTCVYLLINYTPIGLKSLTFRMVIWIVGVLGMLCIISSHFHYTDDVIIAFIFTWSAYIVYHLGLRSPEEEEITGRNYTFTAWWSTFIRFLDGYEQETEKKLPIINQTKSTQSQNGNVKVNIINKQRQ